MHISECKQNKFFKHVLQASSNYDVLAQKSFSLAPEKFIAHSTSEMFKFLKKHFSKNFTCPHNGLHTNLFQPLSQWGLLPENAAGGRAMPLVACPLLRSFPLTESLEQASDIQNPLVRAPDYFMSQWHFNPSRTVIFKIAEE